MFAVILYTFNHLQSHLLPVKFTAKRSLPAMGGLCAATGIVNADMKKRVNPIFVATGEAVAGTMWRYFKGRPEMIALERAGIAVNSLGKHELATGAARKRALCAFVGKRCLLMGSQRNSYDTPDLDREKGYIHL